MRVDTNAVLIGARNKRGVHQWIARAEILEFSKLRPRRVVLDLALTWLLLLITLEISLWSKLIAVYVLAFVLIACFQNALTLWAHEASHFNLSRNKKLNDLIGDLFIAGPLGMTVAQYRWHHVPHHLYLNDPEREVNPLAWICLRGTHLFKEVFVSMIGKHGLEAIGRYGSTNDKHPKRPPRTIASFVSFAISNGLLFGLCVLQGQWWVYFILWIAPIFTLTLMIGNFRTIVEHQASSDVCDVGAVKLPPITRVIRANPIERFLVAPVGLYYHYEHHLFPAIPYHRLGEVRKLLQARGYFEGNDIVYGEGYVMTIWRIAMQPDYGIRLLNPFMEIEQVHEHTY